MKAQIRVALLIVLIVSLTLTGCQRSASKAPITTPAPTEDMPFPLPTENAIKNLASQPVPINPTAAAPAQTQPAAPAASPTSALPPLVLPTSTAIPQVVVPTAAPTFAVIPTATPGLPATYALHAGEWPYCIARRFNVDRAEFLAVNNLTENSRPAEGTMLKIPAGTAGWTSGSRMLVEHPAVYTVKPGDTIYSIACDFGDADPNAIIAANHLTDPFTLTSGSTIQVP